MDKLTNEQKFKTAEERVRAFLDFYGEQKAGTCERCMFQKNGCIGSKVSRGFLCYQNWLALEADEEKPENCPFCGKSCTAHRGIDMVRPHVSCDNDWCGYKSAEEPTIPEAIAAHNRVARAVRAAKKGEAK